jgi:hypothetical protein
VRLPRTRLHGSAVWSLRSQLGVSWQSDQPHLRLTQGFRRVLPRSPGFGSSAPGVVSPKVVPEGGPRDSRKCSPVSDRLILEASVRLPPLLPSPRGCLTIHSLLAGAHYFCNAGSERCILTTSIIRLKVTSCCLGRWKRHFRRI